MRLIRESGTKKKKQAKDNKKHHHDHVASYMKEEMMHEHAVADLFVRKGKE